MRVLKVKNKKKSNKKKKLELIENIHEKQERKIKMQEAIYSVLFCKDPYIYTLNRSKNANPL